jgi:predicted DNA-binding antitoxin AbrB/MazE fold protein
MVSVRAVYRDGKFQPLDHVDLQDGQEVQLQIVEKPTSIQVMIEDMLTHFEPDDSEIDEEAILQELDRVLAGKRPLSEIIIEERRQGR